MRGRSIAAPVALVVACGGGTYVYAGKRYLEDRLCLDGQTSLDVLEGEAPGSCPPVCLVQASLDGGRAIYVATTCAPYPPGFDKSGSDPSCPSALAAAARANGCLEDGGLEGGSPDGG